MGAPIPSDSDSEESESDDTASASMSSGTPGFGNLVNKSAEGSTNGLIPKMTVESAGVAASSGLKISEETMGANVGLFSSDGAGDREPRPKLTRKHASPSTSTLGRIRKSVPTSRLPRPVGIDHPTLLNASDMFGPADSDVDSRGLVTDPLPGTADSQNGLTRSTAEPGDDISRSEHITNPPRARPYHQVVHSGRIKAWTTPVVLDPPGHEDQVVPYVEKFKIDANALLPAILPIFEDDPPLQASSQGSEAGQPRSSDNHTESAKSGKSKRIMDGQAPRLGVATRFALDGSSGLRRNSGSAYLEPEPSKAKEKGGRKRSEVESRPSGARRTYDSDKHNRKQKKNTKQTVVLPVIPQLDNNYQAKGATLSLEPIPENKTLRLPRPRRVPSNDQGADKYGVDTDDPLLAWYFPRRSPDYWEMLDDVSKMFADLQTQEVSLKHFQRPIDYVTVLLCLSNVVFAEMFETLREKVTDTQYRIEFMLNGRTGVNLYLSAYSREHTYIAKSLMHKVNVQLDLARRHSPRSTIQYIHLIECVERLLVHDKRKSWGRIADGHYCTWTDMENPTVIHEVGIAESRAELYRRCKRYISDVPSINLVVAVKVDSSECEWADLLVLARDPSDNRVCKVFNWVRFWGEGAVNAGELRYYPSDFLEVEDRWKIPKAHMRPLDVLDGPR